MQQGYRGLIVWNKAMELARYTYRLTFAFPGDEKYGLASQMRRAAVSIPSNIAEGSKRRSRKEFLNFLRIASGSGAELETQLELARALSFGDISDHEVVYALLNEVMKMLTSMTNTLSSD